MSWCLYFPQEWWHCTVGGPIARLLFIRYFWRQEQQNKDWTVHGQLAIPFLTGWTNSISNAWCRLQSSLMDYKLTLGAAVACLVEQLVRAKKSEQCALLHIFKGDLHKLVPEALLVRWSRNSWESATRTRKLSTSSCCTSLKDFITDSVQTEYCSTFPCVLVSVSQAWHLKFSQ